MGQIQLITSLILIGLFTVAILSFAVNFATDNDAVISLSDDAEISSLISDTETNLEQFEEDSEDTYTSIVETTIESGSGVAPSTGSFAITPLNSLSIAKNIMKVGYVKIFGTGTGFGVFLTSLISLLVFMIGLYLYKTLRGFPD